MISSWQESYDKTTQCVKKQRYHFADKGPYNQTYGLSNSHLQMQELDNRALKNRLDYGLFHLWVGEIPWRRGWLSISVFRPGEFHGLYSPWVQSIALGCNLKNDRMISVHFQGKPFNIAVIQVYAPTSNTEEAEVKRFYEDLQDLLELTPQKDVLFIIGDWNAKVGSQETPGVTGKFGLGIRNEAGQRLIEFCQENTLVIANTFFQQHKRRLYTWISPDGQH